jgi:hypothetical protein
MKTDRQPGQPADVGRSPDKHHPDTEFFRSK